MVISTGIASAFRNTERGDLRRIFNPRSKRKCMMGNVSEEKDRWVMCQRRVVSSALSASDSRNCTPRHYHSVTETSVY